MKEKTVNVSILHSGGGNALMNKLIGNRNKVLCLCIALLLLTVGYLGGLFTAGNPSYATTGSLISKNGVWYGGAGDNGAQITVGWSGWYKINVVAGNVNQSRRHSSNTSPDGSFALPASNMTVSIYLSKGDVLKFEWYQHGIIAENGYYVNSGKWVNTTYLFEGGCDADLIYLNGVPLAGAGLLQSVDNNRFGCGSFYGHDEWKAGTGGNFSFSPAPQHPSGMNRGYGMFEAGTCYLDATRATLVSLTESTQNTVSFRVEAIANTVDDSYDAQISQANYQKEMVEQLKKIANNASSGGSGFTDDVPTVTVNKGANFDVVLSVYDDMTSGSSGTVQVVNSSVGDNIIHLKGKYTEKGVYKVTINSKKFVINVIENPSASNVTVKLE